ncbi:MAG: nucleotidyltransferase family protein [Vampirovibrionales bacterium]|nr:nucleotidyltransferase family protein [Vampirovibrionales bacterium]
MMIYDSPIVIAGFPEAAARVRIEPTATVDEWTIASEQLFGLVPLAKVRVPHAVTTSVSAFAGKGGFTLLLSDGETVLIALPGASGEWQGINFSVDGATVTDCCNTPMVDQPITPQRVTTQAMILGAGLATRFEPVSGDWTGVSKPGAPVVGSASVIRLLVEHLAQFGITDIFINTFYKPEQLKASLAGEGLPRIHYIDEAQPSGTAGALKTLLQGQAAASVQAAFDADKPLLVLQGDAVTNADLGALLVAHQRQHAAVTLGCMLKGDEDVSKFGIVATDHADGRSGRIQTFLEKPSMEEAGPHRLANTGFYVFSPPSYAWVVDAACKKKAGEILDFALDVFPQIMTNCNDSKALHTAAGGFWAQEMSGYWSDIGTPAQYRQTVNDWYTNHPTDYPAAGSLGEDTSGEEMVDRNVDRQLQSVRLLPSGVLMWPGVACKNVTEGLSMLQGPIILAPAAKACWTK